MEGIILSSWDYIMGPQIERLWLTNNKSTSSLQEVPIDVLSDFNSKNSKSTGATCRFANQYDLKTYSMMCGQLLLGEIDSCKDSEQNTSVFYISGSKILVSIIFNMRTWICVGTEKEVENVNLCLAAIFKLEALNSVLENHAVTDAHLRKVVDAIQKAKMPVDSIIDEIFLIVEDLTSLLLFLHHSNLTIFQVHSNLRLHHYFSFNILPMAIVSHLQTSCHTAVLGNSEFKITEILHALSLFCLKAELCNSFPVTQNPRKSCIQGLYVQGIIKDSEKDSDYFLDEAFKENLPLTVVDTDRSKVWQTWPFHDGAEKNKNSFTVKETGFLVPRLLGELSLMRNMNKECVHSIQKFLKYVMMKAVSLIKAVHHYRQRNKCVPKEILMVMFALESIADLEIILGCAEKLKPGIRNYTV